MPPQFPENLDRQFLGPGGVVDDAEDDGRDPPVVRMKNSFEIKGHRRSLDSHRRWYWRVHIT
jgi:hypothetical protein